MYGIYGEQEAVAAAMKDIKQLSKSYQCYPASVYVGKQFPEAQRPPMCDRIQHDRILEKTVQSFRRFAKNFWFELTAGRYCTDIQYSTAQY